MSDQIIIAIIGGTVTILVGVLTAFASFKGAKMQIQKNEEELEKKRSKEKEEQEKKEKKEIQYRAEIIENFIYNEIRENFKLIKTKAFEKDFLKSSKTQQECYVSFHDYLSFSEFDKAKYELIKYKSEHLSKVLSIYEAFKIIKNSKGETRKLSNGEYQKLKEGYTLCLDIFQE
ncbi:hypothetical protein [Bacillus pumilus]|uniref:hypothetical protein n=1 Tax=Bacillus pumilus TaxID=1408 RepID=UPI0011A5884D|nr:hypothetical protein [Bacillus pumilus]